jgi:hypothetical protein
MEPESSSKSPNKLPIAEARLSLLLDNARRVLLPLTEEVLQKTGQSAEGNIDPNRLQETSNISSDTTWESARLVRWISGIEFVLTFLVARRFYVQVIALSGPVRPARPEHEPVELVPGRWASPPASPYEGTCRMCFALQIRDRRRSRFQGLLDLLLQRWLQ